VTITILKDSNILKFSKYVLFSKADFHSAAITTEIFCSIINVFIVTFD